MGNLEAFINLEIDTRGGDAELKRYRSKKSLLGSACEKNSKKWNSSQARV